MESDVTPRDGHYFWSSWLARQSLGGLMLTFVLLSLADLVATLRLSEMGIIREGNALANLAFQSGAAGLILYKALLVGVVLLSTWQIDRRHPVLARSILAGGMVLMAVIALRHLAIMGVTSI